MAEIIAYLPLFLNAFGAATFLPLPSEPLLLAMAHSGDFSTPILWSVASIGNILGALLNWYLGLHLIRFMGRKWFPISAHSIKRVTPYYEQYGKWSLLLAWLPFIGDPLTLIAGVFRTSLWWFIPLVTIGKAGRYGALLIL